jgi:predicted metal-dependent phosphoesterase TrpH
MTDLHIHTTFSDGQHTLAENGVIEKLLKAAV